MPRDETLEVLEEKPRVVALRLQLADLFVLVQHLLARGVQLLRDGREFLKKKGKERYIADDTANEVQVSKRIWS